MNFPGTFPETERTGKRMVKNRKYDFFPSHPFHICYEGSTGGTRKMEGVTPRKLPWTILL